MLKIEIYLKVFLIIFFCFWIALDKSPSTPSYDDAYREIDFLNMDIVILGGSNSLMGLRAERLSFSARNISISSEMGDFHKYLSFVEKHVSAPKIVVYSSLDFWTIGNNKKPFFLPRTSLVQFVYYYFKKNRFDESIINNYGDLEVDKYLCYQKKIRTSTPLFNKNEIEIKKYIDRLIEVKNLYNKARLIVRVPPIYIDSKNSEKAKNYVSYVKKEIENEGIRVFASENSVYSIRSLACNDVWHPNYTHSLILSEELKNHLKNLE